MVEERATTSGGTGASEPPIVVIEPLRTGLSVPWKDLVAARDIAMMLALRHLQVRYRQTVLGIMWAVLQPLVAAVIFTIVFRSMVGAQSGLPYLVFAYSGMSLWVLFSVLVGEGAISVVKEAPLVTKVFFPRAVVPIAVAGFALVDHLFGLVILVLLLVFYGFMPNVGWLLIPVIVSGVVSLALGLALVLSALTVKYRDFRFVIPFGLQMGLFVTPVVYPLDSLPAAVRAIVIWNPMVGWVQAFRMAWTGVPADPVAVIWSMVASVCMLAFGLVYFHRVESNFADIV